MTIPQVLLLTGIPPGQGSVGEIFLRDLVQLYPPNSISCFALNEPGFGTPDPELSEYRIHTLEWPHHQSWKPRTRLAGVGMLASFMYARLIKGESVAEQIIEYGKEKKVDLLWAVLHHPILYSLSYYVAKKLKIPLVSLVWDPSEQIVFNLGLDRISRYLAQRDFNRAVSSSLRCAVMSEGMKQEYETRYGVPTIIIRHGINQDDWVLPADKPDTNYLTIGFAGSIYAKHEWSSLISALSRANWLIAGKQVRIRVLGPSIPPSFLNEARIEYLGYQSVKNTINILSKVDVNYLPYWFDESHSISVQLCFPTKLSTYLASGRPVLYHGPVKSSPTVFFNRFPAAICCHSLDENEIISSLTKLAVDRNHYAQMTSAAYSAMLEELNQNTFKHRFEEFLLGEAYSL